MIIRVRLVRVFASGGARVGLEGTCEFAFKEECASKESERPLLNWN